MYKKKAWLYCRYENSIKITDNYQEKKLEEFALKNNFEVVGISLEYCSGKMLKRPGLEEIKRKISEGVIDTLLVTSLDRISRESSYVSCFLSYLKKNDISIISLKNECINCFWTSIMQA